MEAQIRKVCASNNVGCEIAYSKYKGHATELAREIVAKKVQRVFVAGGDGTVNEVAQALVHTSTALGILPCGSGNGLARHLKVPLITKDSLQLISSYDIIEMDTLRVNGLLSVNVAGIGFDAQVATRFGHDGKRGLTGYARLVLKEFQSFGEFEGTIKINGETRNVKSFIIALANSSQFGNNAKVAPHASVVVGNGRLPDSKSPHCRRRWIHCPLVYWKCSPLPACRNYKCRIDTG